MNEVWRNSCDLLQEFDKALESKDEEIACAIAAARNEKKSQADYHIDFSLED